MTPGSSRETGTSARLDKTFSQADFDAFARLSGDDNPIHCDPGFAATTRFERTVAHGALLCAVLRRLVEEVYPGARQLSQDSQYPAPSPVNEALRFEVETVGTPDPENARRVALALRVTRLCDGVVTCTGATEIEI
ncbi:MAG: acyl dehydratase [Maricaulis maris]|jgi:acyl dehydratase|uniref:MaoC domain protein dehydratase n=1 Tax=Maricaulis maris (strain MCS10) TaxID=394221 RepID=Q0ASY4_MARMM|nr:MULTISPECIES: MaoC/PaaZ C-terminal domain-containing protein [Maricaulis]ABI64603.1 MaoC domain protein dehydratase [Maricaulis maris MCS10]MAC89014.1 hydratase [Maricaulis sp.]